MEFISSEVYLNESLYLLRFAEIKVDRENKNESAKILAVIYNNIAVT